MKKYGQLALVAFVAVPLPLTGAWTASLVAFLFGIPFKKSFASISLGVITAGLIVTFITKTGIAIEKYYGWQVFVGFLLALAFIWLMYYKIQTSRFASCCVRTVGNSFGIKKNSRKNNKYVKPGPLP